MKKCESNLEQYVKRCNAKAFIRLRVLRKKITKNVFAYISLYPYNFYISENICGYRFLE